MGLVLIDSGMNTAGKGDVTAFCGAEGKVRQGRNKQAGGKVWLIA